MMQASFKTLCSTTKEAKGIKVYGVCWDGMIPTIRFSTMEMVKGMDVEVMNWQPPSTSKENVGKTKCPMSIWFNVVLT